MPLAGKHILLLSPQPWGVSRVSKHHYAVEMARRGCRVSFVSPSNEGIAPGGFRLTRIAEQPGLEALSYRLPFPSIIKFKAPRVFDWLMRLQAPRILNALGVRSVDLVWDFASSPIFRNLRVIPARSYIFHPVDMVASGDSRGADVIISLTDAILRKFARGVAPTRFVNHGLSDAFASQAMQRLGQLQGGARASGSEALHVGYAGNLLIPCIDHANYVAILKQNPRVTFHFWGPHSAAANNLGGGLAAQIEFVRFLEAQPNARLHGPVPQLELATALAQMDALLLCYDAARDPNGAANSHKILEYLSTGRPVISTHISSYVAFPGMIEMLPTQDNAEFPEYFRTALSRLAELSGEAMQRRRIEFALDQSYPRQLDRIEGLLTELGLLD